MSCVRSRSNYSIPADQRLLQELYPVHVAVYQNDEASLRSITLIQDQPEAFNNPFRAIQSRFLRTASRVMSSKFLRDLMSFNKITPLELAIIKGKFRIFDILLGCEHVDITLLSQKYMGKNPLLLSLDQGANPAFATLIIEKSRMRFGAGSEPHISFLNFESHLGNRAAHFAAIRGYNAVLLKLAENNADLNARNHNGLTPVQEAVKANNVLTAIFLLQLPGVHLDTDTLDDDENFSIIQEAFSNDNVALLRAILENNPEILETSVYDEEDHVWDPMTLIESAAMHDAGNCFVFLQEQGHVLTDWDRNYFIGPNSPSPRVREILINQQA